MEWTWQIGSAHCPAKIQTRLTPRQHCVQQDVLAPEGGGQSTIATVLEVVTAALGGTPVVDEDPKPPAMPVGGHKTKK